MIEVKLYSPEYKHMWDNFIKSSRIDTFLFYRDYMEYHKDRFNDFSLLFFENDHKLIAILPANIEKNVLYSHKGLTYGGIVTLPSVRISTIFQIFELMNSFLKKNNIEKVVYKPVPFIYHKVPSQEDIYVLFKLNAKKIGCQISSVVYNKNKLEFSKSRKIGVKKAKNHYLRVSFSKEYDKFWNILIHNLQSKYSKLPTHSLEEMLYLHTLFPEHIKLYVVTNNLNEIIAGCVLYITNNVVHVQYISANEEGKSVGALDLLFFELINIELKDYLYFDFGYSTEKMGEYLNENLIFQKEGFGAKGVVYEIYEYKLS